nr:thioredoxin domain-containing protein [Baia soyae]
MDVQNHEFEEKVRRDNQLVEEQGIKSVPALFINGTEVSASSYGEIKKAIDKEIENNG